MAFDDNEPLDLDSVDLGDEPEEELKELSQEEEAMKVLTRIAREHGLTAEDDDLIRQIYTDAVSAHDNDQTDADVPTAGRKLYERISKEFQSAEGEQL